ncbi:unnamed protein product [Amoebophrya sp. A120]|nr:unnamed protein product [Amoebophrya sp. A120]|eukprot:GSA120T00025704001.1
MLQEGRSCSAVVIPKMKMKFLTWSSTALFCLLLDEAARAASFHSSTTPSVQEERRPVLRDEVVAAEPDRVLVSRDHDERNLLRSLPPSRFESVAFSAQPGARNHASVPQDKHVQQVPAEGREREDDEWTLADLSSVGSDFVFLDDDLESTFSIRAEGTSGRTAFHPGQLAETSAEENAAHATEHQNVLPQHDHGTKGEHDEGEELQQAGRRTAPLRFSPSLLTTHVWRTASQEHLSEGEDATVLVLDDEKLLSADEILSQKIRSSDQAQLLLDFLQPVAEKWTAALLPRTTGRGTTPRKSRNENNYRIAHELSISFFDRASRKVAVQTKAVRQIGKAEVEEELPKNGNEVCPTSTSETRITPSELLGNGTKQENHMNAGNNKQLLFSPGASGMLPLLVIRLFRAVEKRCENFCETEEAKRREAEQMRTATAMLFHHATYCSYNTTMYNPVQHLIPSFTSVTHYAGNYDNYHCDYLYDPLGVFAGYPHNNISQKVVDDLHGATNSIGLDEVLAGQNSHRQAQNASRGGSFTIMREDSLDSSDESPGRGTSAVWSRRDGLHGEKTMAASEQQSCSQQCKRRVWLEETNVMEEFVKVVQPPQRKVFDIENQLHQLNEEREGRVANLRELLLRSLGRKHVLTAPTSSASAADKSLSKRIRALLSYAPHFARAEPEFVWKYLLNSDDSEEEQVGPERPEGAPFLTSAAREKSQLFFQHLLLFTIVKMERLSQDFEAERKDFPSQILFDNKKRGSRGSATPEIVNADGGSKDPYDVFDRIQDEQQKWEIVAGFRFADVSKSCAVLVDHLFRTGSASEHDGSSSALFPPEVLKRKPKKQQDVAPALCESQPPSLAGSTGSLFSRVLRRLVPGAVSPLSPSTSAASTNAKSPCSSSAEALHSPASLSFAPTTSDQVGPKGEDSASPDVSAVEALINTTGHGLTFQGVHMMMIDDLPTGFSRSTSAPSFSTSTTRQASNNITRVADNDERASSSILAENPNRKTEDQATATDEASEIKIATASTGFGRRHRSCGDIAVQGGKTAEAFLPPRKVTPAGFLQQLPQEPQDRTETCADKQRVKQEQLRRFTSLGLEQEKQFQLADRFVLDDLRFAGSARAVASIVDSFQQLEAADSSKDRFTDMGTALAAFDRETRRAQHNYKYDHFLLDASDSWDNLVADDALYSHKNLRLTDTPCGFSPGLGNAVATTDALARIMYHGFLGTFNAEQAEIAADSSSAEVLLEDQNRLLSIADAKSFWRSVVGGGDANTPGSVDVFLNTGDHHFNKSIKNKDYDSTTSRSYKQSIVVDHHDDDVVTTTDENDLMGRPQLPASCSASALSRERATFSSAASAGDGLHGEESIVEPQASFAYVEVVVSQNAAADTDTERGQASTTSTSRRTVRVKNFRKLLNGATLSFGGNALPLDRSTTANAMRTTSAFTGGTASPMLAPTGNFCPFQAVFEKQDFSLVWCMNTDGRVGSTHGSDQYVETCSDLANQFFQLKTHYALGKGMVERFLRSSLAERENLDQTMESTKADGVPGSRKKVLRVEDDVSFLNCENDFDELFHNLCGSG